MDVRLKAADCTWRHTTSNQRRSHYEVTVHKFGDKTMLVSPLVPHMVRMRLTEVLERKMLDPETNGPGRPEHQPLADAEVG